MRELWPWLKLIGERRRRLAIGLLLMALTLASGIALLALAGWFLTAASLAGLLLAAGTAVSFDIYIPGGGIRLFALTRTVSRYAERVYNHDTVLRLLADLRVRLFRDLARLSPGRQPVRRGADWLARLTSDLDSLDTLYLRLVAPLALALLLSIVLVLVTVWLLDLLAGALVALLLGLSLLLATWALHRATGAIAGRRVERLETIRRLAIEHLEGNAELSAAGALGRHRDRLMTEAASLGDEQHQLDRRIGWYGALATLAGHLPVVVVLWFGVAALQAQAIEGALVVLLALALLALNEAIQGLPEAFGRLGGTLAAARRLNSDTVGPHLTSSRPAETDGPAWGLDFESVTTAYPGLPPLMSGWSLTIEPGQRTGLVGASGSGKSSLADLAAGLVEPEAGQCSLYRDQQRLVTGGERMAQVSYLTQNTQLLDDTLRANLCLGLPGADDHTLWQVLEAVALAELVAQLPNGLDTWFGPRGHSLSGGEARRVALARALLRPAPVLVLDEPFTGLDRATRDAVSRGIEPYLAGRTLLALGHDRTALPALDKVIQLDG